MQTRLGITTSMKAEFYNLLVYEKGGKFLPHRDSEKAESMFGTLVIVMPSMHEGGELVVRHAGEKQVFACGGPQGICAPYWFAFYADCQHELLPVKSGYRVALIYNLLRNDGRDAGAMKPPSQARAADAFAKLACRWTDDVSSPNKLVYILDHKYTDAGIGRDSLKGNDEAVAQAFQIAGKVRAVENDGASSEGSSSCGKESKVGIDKENDIGLFDLVLATITHAENADDEYDEVIESDTEVKKCLPLGSLPRRLTESMTIHDDENVHEEFFLDAEADDSDHEGPTGNAGSPVTRWYHRAAIILWPRRLRAYLLGLTYSLDCLYRALEGNTEALCGYKDVADLQKACMSLPSTRWNASSYKLMIPLFLRKDISVDACCDFLRTVNLLKTDLSSFVPQLSQIIDKHGCHCLKDSLVHLGVQNARNSMAATQKTWMMIAMLCGAADHNGELLKCVSPRTPGVKQFLAIEQSGARALLDALVVPLVPCFLPSTQKTSRNNTTNERIQQENVRQIATGIATAIVTLHKLERQDLIEACLSLIVENPQLYDPIQVVTPALLTLLQKFPDGKVPGVGKLFSGIVESLQTTHTCVATQYPDMLLRLFSKARKLEEFPSLFARAVKILEELTSKPLPQVRDWKVAINLTPHCHCHSCASVLRFLRDPLNDGELMMRGRDATWNGHLIKEFSRPSRQPGSGFTLELLSSKAAFVNGRLRIGKTRDGRTPVATLRSHFPKIQRQKRLRNLLQKLKSIESSPNGKRPAMDLTDSQPKRGKLLSSAVIELD